MFGVVTTNALCAQAGRLGSYARDVGISVEAGGDTLYQLEHITVAGRVGEIYLVR